MAKKGKRQKIDWDNIKITIVHADKDNPNPHNPCCGSSKAERERRIVSIAARIWRKYICDTMLFVGRKTAVSTVGKAARM